ncbi:hypothetical protein IIA15_05830 [candidate division TA06 bacterium]|nr:hypothetical protein [candidate division TA06 bacterium]
MEILGIWIAALLTLALYSFLYKDNPVYKIAEHIFVGISAGYWLARSYRDVVLPNFWNPLLEGNFLLIIPGILGVMMLMRILPKIGWISRWSLSFIIGMTSGLFLITYLQSNAVDQVRATFLPLNSINNVLLIFGVLTGLVYFFFSKEHKGVFGVTAKVGIYFLMVAFGASFGYTVMARISLLIGRMQFLLFEWLPTIPLFRGLGGG